MSFVEDLRWRGLVEDVTPELEAALEDGTTTGYVGFDPTASSLHVGSLLPVLALARLQRAGHRPVGIVGGGTGLIGDPSGKSQERQLLTYEQVEENVAGIRAQLERYLDFDGSPTGAVLVNNAEWLTTIGLMEFLRDVGKHFTVNAMLAKESVRRRLTTEDGLSFTEFSYMLLQAYDFLVLYDRYGCTLQMGGTDQWGNILAGVDLIRRLRSARAHGLVSPLVTDSAGRKFGKTEAGAVWLDRERTSPYQFYQFWLNVADADAVRYLRYFTFLDRERIAEIEHEFERDPKERLAQRILAEEVTRMAHGREALAGAERVTDFLFGKEVAELRAEDLRSGLADAPTTEVARTELASGLTAVDLLVTSGLAASKGAARRLIADGGAYLNSRRLAEDRPLTAEEAIDGELFLLRKGKKTYHLVRIAG